MNYSTIRQFLLSFSALSLSLSSLSFATSSPLDCEHEVQDVAKVLTQLPIKIENEGRENEQSRKRLADARTLKIKQKNSKRKKSQEESKVLDLTRDNKPIIVSLSSAISSSLTSEQRSFINYLNSTKVLNAAMHALPKNRPLNFKEATELFQAVVDDPQASQEKQISARYNLGILKKKSDPQGAAGHFQAVVDDQQASQEIKVKARYSLGFMKRESDPEGAAGHFQAVVDDQQAPIETKAKAKALLGFIIADNRFPNMERHKGILLLTEALKDGHLQEGVKQHIKEYLNKK